MRYLVILLVVGGLGLAGYFAWKERHNLAPTPIQKNEATAVVEKRDVEFAVIAAGDIGPADQVSVRMEVNGRIAELPVDIGDVVKSSNLLCRLDDRDLQIERDQNVTGIAGAKLQIEAANLRLLKAQRDYDRGKTMLDQNLISKEAYDNFKTEMDAALNQKEIAQNNQERAEKALKLVDDRITKTRMKAPFDCTVLTRPVSLGQTVSGAAGFNSGTEIMTIANLNDLVVNAHINQADVIRLNPNQLVDIQVESLPGVKIEGRVERIAPQATIRNGIKGFTTRIQIKQLDARVRPGMTATLTIPVANADNVLTVPLAAVFTEENERYVFVKTPAGMERRTVTVGITDFQFAEVQSGLSEGETVFVELPKEGLPEQPGKNGDKKNSKTAQKSKGSTNGATGGKTVGGTPGDKGGKRYGT